jgi:hypothetical protein
VVLERHQLNISYNLLQTEKYIPSSQYHIALHQVLRLKTLAQTETCSSVQTKRSSSDQPEDFLELPTANILVRTVTQGLKSSNRPRHRHPTRLSRTHILWTTRRYPRSPRKFNFHRRQLEHIRTCVTCFCPRQRQRSAPRIPKPPPDRQNASPINHLPDPRDPPQPRLHPPSHQHLRLTSITSFSTRRVPLAASFHGKHRARPRQYSILGRPCRRCAVLEIYGHHGLGAGVCFWTGI